MVLGNKERLNIKRGVAAFVPRFGMLIIVFNVTSVHMFVPHACIRPFVLDETEQAKKHRSL